MDWAVPADEGDAAAAAREAERWRADLPEPRPLDGVLAQIRERLQLLWMTPLVRGDPDCVGILDAMRACRDMAEFEAGVSRLRARVAQILAERAAARPVPAPRLPRPAAEPFPEPPRRASRSAWRSFAES